MLPGLLTFFPSIRFFTLQACFQSQLFTWVKRLRASGLGERPKDARYKT